jgi:hypothetical protein
VALGLPIIAYGIVYGRTTGANYIVSIIGLLITLGGVYGWALEPSVEPPSPDAVDAAHGAPALVGAPQVPALGAADGDAGVAEGEEQP